MINLDEDALICDFAETYQIYDYRSLPLRTVATLAAGLRDNSRIKLLASGTPATQEVLLLAAIADRIDAIRYGFADKEPPSLVRSLFGETKKDSKSDAMAFSTPDEFKKAYAKAIKGE